MRQFYTNPSRENDPYALPNAEVFYVEMGEWYYDLETGEPCEPTDKAAIPTPSGYYWWPCFPGCLPDGPPNGPFDTEEEAIADARDGYDSFE